MKLLYLNIRGVGNSGSRRELSNYCCQYHPDLVCISEPMVSLDSIPTGYWASLNLKLLTMNNHGTLIPNIWIFGSQNVSTFSLICSSEQQVTIQLTLDDILS